jgi:hypothetical protein
MTMLDPSTGAMGGGGAGRMIAVAIVTILFGTAGALAVHASLADCDEEEDSTELILQVVDLQEEPPADVDEVADVDDEDDCDVADEGDDEDAADITIATEAYVNGDFQRARIVAQRVEGSPVDSLRDRALRMDAAASCYLGDREAALTPFAMLEDPASRDFVRYVCARNEVSLP